MRRSALTSLAAATALALGSPVVSAQTGMQFAPAGNGSIAGSLFFPQVVWNEGDVIVDNAWFRDSSATVPGPDGILGTADDLPNLPGAEIGASVGIYGQAWSDVPMQDPSFGYFTFQYEFQDGLMWQAEGAMGAMDPVYTQSAIVVNDSNGTTDAGETSIAASGGRWQMFFTPGVDFPEDTGIHFSGACHGGELGSQPACAGPIKILEGVIELVAPAPPDSAVFSLDQAGLAEQPIETNTPVSAGPTNPAFADVGTRTIEGSEPMDIDILWQNDLWIVNNLVGTSMTFDTNLSNGLLAPYENEALNTPTINVAGREAFFGEDQAWGTGPFAGSFGPLNNFACNVNPAGGFPDGEWCDVQVRQEGSSEFRGTRIPEPAPLLLMGLGIALMGFLGRRGTRKTA